METLRRLSESKLHTTNVIPFSKYGPHADAALSTKTQNRITEDVHVLFKLIGNSSMKQRISSPVTVISTHLFG